MKNMNKSSISSIKETINNFDFVINLTKFVCKESLDDENKAFERITNFLMKLKDKGEIYDFKVFLDNFDVKKILINLYATDKSKSCSYSIKLN